MNPPPATRHPPPATRHPSPATRGKVLPDVFDAVDNQAKKSLETLSQKKGEAENQVKIIESAIEQTEALMKRNLNAEILGFNETFDEILQEQGTQESVTLNILPGLVSLKVKN